MAGAPIASGQTQVYAEEDGLENGRKIGRMGRSSFVKEDTRLGEAASLSCSRKAGSGVRQV